MQIYTKTQTDGNASAFCHLCVLIMFFLAEGLSVKGGRVRAYTGNSVPSWERAI